METTTPAFIQQTPKPVAQAPVASPAPQAQPNIQSASPQTITAKDGTVLDAGIVNLSKAIRQQESGGNYNAIGDNGTSHGAYQWNKDNFAKDAQQFGLDPNDFSPVNQDKVAYAQINAYKQAGYSPEQIASLWNSGKPDATGNKGTTVINGKPVNYDTPKYVANVMSYFQQNKSQNPGEQAPTGDLASAQAQSPASPSVGGFLQNTVQSGANFLGNTANALLHPIQTIQNVGGAAVGGLQELGGQTNDNTAKFDSLKDYFSQRYGSVDNLLHTAYTDPVGLAADVSAALGVGGGIAGAVGKGAELAGAGNLAREATSLAPAIEGSGLAGGLQDVSKLANKGSVITNPLTPIVSGAGALLGKTKNLSDIIANPSNYTPEEISNSTRTNIGQQVETALNDKMNSLSETGSAYQPLKEAPVPITTTADGLDNLLRDSLKVDITDGIIKANSTSELRDATAISKLQGIYNTYKTDFLNGTMDSQKFLNLRNDLGDIAYNDSGIRNTKVASAAEDVRNSLNNSYREQIPNLKETDASYSAQKTELKALRKGFIDKEGNLLESATNKIANSLGKGKDAQLSRLEEIVPGITRKLQVMKTIEDMQKGSFTSTIAEKGGIVGGLLSGNIQGAALAFTSIILSKPEIAIPLLRAVGANIPLVKAIMANLAKYTTIGNVSSQSNLQQTSPQSTELPLGTDQSQLPEALPQTGSPQLNQNLSSSNPTTPNFDTQGALKAGYTQAQIDKYLASIATQ